MQFFYLNNIQVFVFPNSYDLSVNLGIYSPRLKLDFNISFSFAENSSKDSSQYILISSNQVVNICSLEFSTVLVPLCVVFKMPHASIAVLDMDTLKLSREDGHKHFMSTYTISIAPSQFIFSPSRGICQYNNNSNRCRQGGPTVF